MTNPINPFIVVPWGNRTYNCDLTLGQLAIVEGEIGLGIVFPGARMLWDKPEAYQRAVITYALLRSTEATGVTLDMCAEAVTGPKHERYAEACVQAVKRIMPKLTTFYPSREAEETSPLAETSGGLESGPERESTSESPNESSGT